MICPNCGKETADNAAFCKECGGKLQPAEQNTAPVQPAAPEFPAQPAAPMPAEAPMPSGAPPQAPVYPQMQPGMMPPAYAAPAQPAGKKNSLVIAVIMLFVIGFLAQGLFTGTMFKFMEDVKVNGRRPDSAYSYNSYSILDPFLNSIDVDKQLYNEAADKHLRYYLETGKVSAEFLDLLQGEDEAETSFLAFGVALFVSAITVFIAMFFQIAALVHICRKNEEWAWKRMKATSIWVLISKIVGFAAVVFVSGKMNNLPKNNVSMSSRLYSITKNGEDIMKIAPQAWITLILCIAAVVVCCIFRSKTKQPKQAQQPAVPYQPAAPVQPMQ